MRRLLLLGLLTSWALPSHAVEAPLPTLLDRAKTFESAGLPALAREQYKFILRRYPKAPGVEPLLNALSRREAVSHLQSARRAHEAGVMSLSLRELDRALANTPNDSQLKSLRAEWKKEAQLRSGLRASVSKDYLQGLALYQKGENDRALESFLKVLNLDPYHKGAMGYVERIGQSMDVERP